MAAREERGHPRASRPFRSDINGLRAVAVLAVMGYHFGIPGFSGGFIGVDVFFVISGYLMTQIIVSRWSEGKLSIADFYAARARRIVPALVVLVAVLLAGGYFFLISSDYRELAVESLSAVTFLSNVLFWRQVGYFEAPAHEKWLLHTWSLSVEWQFYALFPVFMAAFLRLRSARHVLHANVAAFTVSLALSVALTPFKQTASFFLLPTRTWELLAGSIVYLLAARPGFSLPARVAPVGLLLVIGATVLFHRDMGFPGFWALVPVLGTALVISAQTNHWVLSNRLFGFIGDNSYSLYLWHWPVAVSAALLGVASGTINVALLVLMSVTLAWLSCTYVETPYRGSRHKGRSMALPLSVCVAVGVLSLAVWKLAGIPSRLPAAVYEAENEQLNFDADARSCAASALQESPRLHNCNLGSATSTNTVVLLGDSHAESSLAGFKTALSRTGRSGSAYIAHACPPLRQISTYIGLTETRCKLFNDAVRENILNDPRISDVILVTRWSYYLNGIDMGLGRREYFVGIDGALPQPPNQQQKMGFTHAMVDSICELAAAGKRVSVLAPIPAFDRNVPKTIAQLQMLKVSQPDVTMSKAEYLRENAEVLRALAEAKNRCGIQVLDPLPYLCHGEVCGGQKDGRPMYIDKHHLSEFGSGLLAPLLAHALQSAPVASRSPRN